MERQMVEFIQWDKIKLDNRRFKHIVTFYMQAKGRKTFTPDNGTSLQVTPRVAHFLFHAQSLFTPGKDKLFIHATTDMVVDHCYILEHGVARVDMVPGRAGDRPIAYLASPFFCQQEKEVVAELELLIENAGYDLYSPSRDGITLKPDAPEEERVQVLEENMRGIEDAAIIVANTDGQSIRTVLNEGEIVFIDALCRDLTFGRDIMKKLSRLISRDPGTYWELGYAHGLNKPTVTYSHQGYDINVMIGASVLAHTKSADELLDLLKQYLPIASPLSVPTFRVAEVVGSIQAKYKRPYAVT